MKKTGDRHMRRHALTMEFTGEWMSMKLLGAIVSMAALMIAAIAIVASTL